MKVPHNQGVVTESGESSRLGKAERPQQTTHQNYRLRWARRWLLCPTYLPTRYDATEVGILDIHGLRFIAVY